MGQHVVKRFAGPLGWVGFRLAARPDAAPKAGAPSTAVADQRPRHALASSLGRIFAGRPASPARVVLTDATGARLGLTLRGYQFPRATDVDDANSLLVSLVADDGQDAWTATQPALLTWEVVQLVGWLRAVADGARCPDSIDFAEPDLAFAADGTGDAARLTVRLAAGFRPAWAPPFEAATVRVRPGVDGLRRFADALAAALDASPICGARPELLDRW